MRIDISNRIGTTSNQGGFKGLLDVYSGAAAAYSLRKLSKATTSVVRVRRDSDNAEADFTALEITDGTLAAFCTGTDGLVTTIYDQSGNGNDLTQGTATRQGFIVSAGVLNTLNGQPVIFRSIDDNGGYRASALNFVSDTNIYGSYWVVKRPNSGDFCIFGSSTGGSDYGYFSVDGSTSTIVNNVVVASSEKINNNSWVYSTRGDVYDDLANQSFISAGIQFNYSASGYSLGYRFSNPSSFGMAQFQEHVLYPDLTNRSGIEANINNYYNIY